MLVLVSTLAGVAGVEGDVCSLPFREGSCEAAS